MTNPLCDEDTADCIGFPASLGGSCPTALVRCVGGDLGVQSVKVAKPFIDSIGDTLNIPLTVGTHYGTLLEVEGTNPWCDDAIIWVNHEFGMSLTASWSDNWGMAGDISCGGTGVGFINDGVDGSAGSYALGGNNGSSQTPNNVLQQITLHHSFVSIYRVPAGGAFTIRQQVRLTVGAVGASRILNYYVSTMKGITMLRQP